MLFKHWKTKGLKKGDKIESQNDITKFCDFSLITIIKTLNDLQDEGVIQRKVGKGSYLNNAPWFTNHLRIGFFYNRDVVGGGIFNNNFYTKIVVAFEKQVISDGHEFILGSFTHKTKPILLWDDLNAVALTGVTAETDTSAFNTTSCLLSFIEKQVSSNSKINYHIDFEPSFNEMFKNNNNNNKFLYLDSKIDTVERDIRTKAFKTSFKNYGKTNTLKIISVDQENEPHKTAKLVKMIIDFKPDFVCGYIHLSWYELIQKVSQKEVKIYSPLLDTNNPGFIVNSSEWMKKVLPDIYLKLNDRKTSTQPKPYLAKFVP
jgi:hypothetical protein